MLSKYYGFFFFFYAKYLEFKQQIILYMKQEPLNSQPSVLSLFFFKSLFKIVVLEVDEIFLLKEKFMICMKPFITLQTLK